MPKFTDTQLIVLSEAAKRDDGAASAPSKLNKPALAKLAENLVSRKLMRETRAKPGMPVWREDDGRRVALVITRAGRDAIGVDDSTPATITPAKPTVRREPAVAVAVNAPRAGSKQALLVAMLTEKSGATIEALTAATGWLPDTTRAALTGLRKKGFVIERPRGEEDKASVYRISAPAPAVP